MPDLRANVPQLLDLATLVETAVGLLRGDPGFGSAAPVIQSDAVSDTVAAATGQLVSRESLVQESLAAVASFPSDAAAALQDADARLAAKVG
ncbi:hypothetical protein [Cryobacterium zhongshanensis]|uniref:Uncharacterized protein n=1 Tax=Cryobacterium zhongshanensis TaxID=2928153 RepID=A0AA41UKB6_9MICO|nr:hypothetical protein [Cryobacterium zhongshanensis]MCI4657786.1 hypothetical protein [Cryobacterium zhongshanensis]